MNYVDSVSISSVIAYLLLFKEEVTAFEISSFIDKIFREHNVYVEEDDFERLSCCVLMCNGGMNFKIKDNLDYDSLVGDVTVFEYLRLCSSEIIAYYGDGFENFKDK